MVGVGVVAMGGWTRRTPDRTSRVVVVVIGVVYDRPSVHNKMVVTKVTGTVRATGHGTPGRVGR